MLTKPFNELDFSQKTNTITRMIGYLEHIIKKKLEGRHYERMGEFLATVNPIIDTGKLFMVVNDYEREMTPVKKALPIFSL